MPFFFLKLPHDLTAWLSFLVALCALGISIHQGVAARRHDRLSVQPKLDWTARWLPSKPLRLSLKNGGLGTAVILELKILFDGEEYLVADDGSVPGLHAALTQLSSHVEVHCVGFDSNIMPGEKINLFLFRRSTESVHEHNYAVKLLKKIGFRCTYKSLYGDLYSVSREEGTGPDGATV